MVSKEIQIPFKFLLALVLSRLTYMLVLVFCNQFVPNTTSTYHLVSFQIAAIEDVFAHPCPAEHSRAPWVASDLDLLSP